MRDLAATSLDPTSTTSLDLAATSLQRSALLDDFAASGSPYEVGLRAARSSSRQTSDSEVN